MNRDMQNKDRPTRSDGNVQRPARPQQNAQRREPNAQRREPNAQRREPNAQRREPNAQRREPNAQLPRPQSPEQMQRRAAQDGQRPPRNINGGAPRRPESKNAKRPNRAPEKPARRRNEESYVFSRSLSETRDRILTERRERLEDARVFRREDVREKMRYGIISFCSVLALAIIITAIAISCTLSGGRVKKARGEYEYKLGKNTSAYAYTDKAKDGIIYIRMNSEGSLSELCGLTVGGKASEPRFTTPSGDWISFSHNSSQAKINGYGMEMPAPANIKNEVCYVPLEFLETVLDGISVDINEEKKTVTVTRDEYEDSTDLEPHYKDVIFMLKADVPLNSLDENKYFAGQPLFSFKNDLSAYEDYMNPTGSLQNAFLMLLNKEFPLEDTSYDPNTVQYTNETHGVYKDYWIEPTAGKAIEALMMEMKAAGITDTYVTSAYRSYNYQSALYYTYIDNEMAADPSLSRAEAEAIVQTYSAVPGYSEHHTGLCVDFFNTAMDELDETFADTEAFDWLCANAWKFGFILRYPENKVNETGYSYEPWHWRYVGRTHALEMLKSGECFEEYLSRTGLGNTSVEE